MPLPRLLPRRRRTRVLAAVAVLLLLAGGAGGWALLARADADEPTTITATVSRGTYKDTVTATGTITPKRQADLSFTASGTVTSVEVEVGDRVKKGDTLARIDATSLAAQVEAAEAQVDAAEEQVAEDADASSAQRSASSASLASARSRLEQARASYDAATLTSPIDGTVSSVGYSVGDTVGAGGNQAAGTATPQISVISPKKLLVEATVPAADVSRLKKGLQAEITPTGGTDVVYGTVQEVGVIADASDTGAAVFPVTIAVTGTPTGLYAGASATVAITVKQATDVLTVPTGALRSEDDKTYVYVVADGKRERRDVEVGTAYGAQTEVLSGLEEGDVVEVASFRRTGGARDGQQGGFPGGMQLPPGGIPAGGQGPVIIQGGP